MLVSADVDTMGSVWLDCCITGVESFDRTLLLFANVGVAMLDWMRSKLSMSSEVDLRLAICSVRV